MTQVKRASLEKWMTLSWRGPLAKVAFGLIWMTLTSQIAVFLPFTSVPITLGPTAAVFLGMMLGPRYAAASLVTYVAMGLMGLPVFAGWSAFLSPRTGYLIGYIPAAFCMGWLVERISHLNAWKIFAAALFSHMPLYICGVIWLTPYVGVKNVLMMGVVPFLPGLVLKTAVLSSAAAWIKKSVQK